MLQLQKKLSRRDKFLLVLVGLVVLLNLYFYRSNLQVNQVRERLVQQVKVARVSLTGDRQRADLAPLQAEKQALAQQTVGQVLTAAEADEVTLRLWEWADSSGVNLPNMTRLAGQTKLGEENFPALQYTLEVQGQVPNLYGFLSQVSTSTYTPLVDSFSLSQLKERGSWKMSIKVSVMVQE